MIFKKLLFENNAKFAKERILLDENVKNNCTMKQYESCIKRYLKESKAQPLNTCLSVIDKMLKANLGDTRIFEKDFESEFINLVAVCTAAEIHTTLDTNRLLEELRLRISRKQLTCFDLIYQDLYEEIFDSDEVATETASFIKYMLNTLAQEKISEAQRLQAIGEASFKGVQGMPHFIDSSEIDKRFSNPNPRTDNVSLQPKL